MATVTPNIGLTLPAGNEKVSRQTINDNMVIIDTAFGNAHDSSVDSMQAGLSNVVDGDTTDEAIPAGAYAYIKNNEHSLAEGYYQNTSGSAFPASGGTADSTVFTHVSTAGILNSLNNNINGEDFSSDISVYSGRITISKIYARKYSDGKHVLFIQGKVAINLTGAQSSILLISGANQRATLISGTANVGGIPYFVCASNSSNTNYINVRHEGLSANADISIMATWYELT